MNMNMNMNGDTSWNDIKKKIKTKWDKFSETEIEAFKNDMDSISIKIQKVYGTAKDMAEKEYRDFKETIKSTKISK